MERFLRNGLVGRYDLPEATLKERRALARAEAEHFAAMMADEPIGVQIGIVPDTLPHASFQIFRQPDRQVLALSPFRLGEQPNIRVGVAMITSAPEALALHDKMAKELWQRALKGTQAVTFMRDQLARAGIAAAMPATPHTPAEAAASVSISMSWSRTAPISSVTFLMPRSSHQASRSSMIEISAVGLRKPA